MESCYLPNLSVQIAPDCISEYLNFQNFLGEMPPDPPSKSRLRPSKWALSRPYCQYSELCHARAYKQKKARNAPDMKTKFVIIRYLRNYTFTVRQNSSIFTYQIRQHSISREEFMVSFDVHLHTCELIPYNNQGDATTRPESSRHLETFRLRTQPQLLQTCKGGKFLKKLWRCVGRSITR